MSVNDDNKEHKIMLPSTTKYSVTKTRKNGNKFSITYLSNFKNNSILSGQTIQ